MSDVPYDLVIIGGGVAATHSLLSILDAAPLRRLRIAVIEQSADLWRGVPYGARSSINSLIITDLDEFTPPAERDAFIAFLSANWPKLSQSIRDEGGAVGSAWLQRHAEELAAGAWGGLYVPRRFYGDFLSQKTIRKLEQSHARVDTFTGSVSSVTRRDGGFEITMATGVDATRLSAARILLAVGSPPVQRIAGEASGHGQTLVIEDAYQPSLDANLAQLAALMERLPQARRRLLVLGSNATSLEFTYMLQWSPALRRMLDRVVVLSGGGRLPERIIPAREGRHTPALDALDGRPALSADAIFAASQSDIHALVGASGDEGCDFSPITERLVQILSQADETEVRRFHHVYGMPFTRLIRRAGCDYRDAAQALLDDGKMELRAGRLEGLSFSEAGCTPRGAGRDGAPLDLGPPFAAIVNCSGFEPLSNVTHPLLANLLDKGLVRPNPTGRGFEIDESFRAGPHIFVAGPLLAGVFNPSARFWHVENVRRIADLAPHLAAAILRDCEG